MVKASFCALESFSSCNSPLFHFLTTSWVYFSHQQHNMYRPPQLLYFLSPLLIFIWALLCNINCDVTSTNKQKHIFYTNATCFSTHNNMSECMCNKPMTFKHQKPNFLIDGARFCRVLCANQRGRRKGKQKIWQWKKKVTKKNDRLETSSSLGKFWWHFFLRHLDRSS